MTESNKVINNKLDALLIRCNKLDSLENEMIDIKHSLNKLDTLDKLVIEVKSNSDELNLLKNELKSVKAELVAVKKEMNKREEENFKEISALKAQSDYQENQSRRNNVIIIGVEDVEQESWKESAEKARDFFISKLQVDVPIERAHRLGKRIKDRNRPIMVKLSSFPDKVRVLDCCSKLKNTGCYVNEDYSERVRKIRQELVIFVKKEFPGKKFRLNFDNLIVESKKFKVGPVGVFELKT